MEEYKKKTIKGIKWSTVSQVVSNFLLILTTTILARILQPTDFGLMGMAITITGFIDVFKSLGTTDALIQEQEANEKYISSVFWINVIFGAILFFVLFLFSPLAGMFYNDIRVERIIKLLSINFFISGIGITQKAILEKELRFDQLAKAEIFSILAGSLLGIVSAINGFGVYSLVIQTFSRTTVFTINVLLIAKYVPKVYISSKETKKIFKFSYFLIFHQIQNYFSRNIDYLLIGKFLGPLALGYYTMAYKLMLMPIRSISNSVSKVTFSIYSLHQNDNHKIQLIVKNTTEFISFITIPMMFGIFYVADPLVIALLGEKWLPSIKIIMILSILGIIQSISIPLNSIFVAKGKSNYLFIYGIMTTIAVTIGISIGLKWGVVGVSVGYLASGLVSVLPAFYYRLKMIDMPINMFITSISRSLVSGTIMIFFLFIIEIFENHKLNTELRSVVLVVAGITIYSICSFIINKAFLSKVLKGTFN